MVFFQKCRPREKKCSFFEWSSLWGQRWCRTRSSALALMFEFELEEFPLRFPFKNGFVSGMGGTWCLGVLDGDIFRGGMGGGWDWKCLELDEISVTSIELERWCSIGNKWAREFGV